MPFVLKHSLASSDQLYSVMSHKRKLYARNKSSKCAEYAGMEATCSVIPLVEITLEGKCFKEVFLLMH